jgi:hypothetical protein
MVLWSLTDKAVNMIGHDNISSDGNAAGFRFLRVGTESFMHGIGCQKGVAMGCAERNEIYGRIIGLKNVSKAAGFAGVFIYAKRIAKTFIMRNSGMNVFPHASGETLLHCERFPSCFG